MPDDDPQPQKAVIVESTTVTRRAEGENAAISFTGSKHMTKWLVAAVGLLLANLGHNVVGDFLPPKDAGALEAAKVTATSVTARNDSDNQKIFDKLNSILEIKGQVDKLVAITDALQKTADQTERHLSRLDERMDRINSKP
jgi:hypothetical protein